MKTQFGISVCSLRSENPRDNLSHQFMALGYTTCTLLH